MERLTKPKMFLSQKDQMNFDYNLFRDALAEKESTDNYQAVNEGNYLGRYQLGAPALIEAGFVKPGTKNKGLNSPKNWIVGSKKEFLNTPELQEKAMLAYTQKNFGYAQKLGLINQETTPEEQAAILAGTHLVGARGFKKALAGADVRDANGVKPQQYYSFMLDRFKQTTPKAFPDMGYEQQMADNNDLFQNSLRNMMLGGAP